MHVLVYIMQCAVGLPLERASLIYKTIECLLIGMVDHVVCAKAPLSFKISRDWNKIERVPNVCLEWRFIRVENDYSSASSSSSSIIGLIVAKFPSPPLLLDR